MRLALAQYALVGDIRINLRRLLSVMHEASERGANMIAFPELCLSPFFPRLAGQDASRYAMPLDDDSIREMQAQAKRLRLAAAPNVYLQEGHQRYDASLMISAEGEILGVSKMVHIAQLPGFYEQDYYAASDTGFKVYDLPQGKTGIVVCFDRHYPESTRTCTLRGAQLVIIPTANTMVEPRDLFECELRAAAMQNGIFIAMCNRVGAEGDTVFCGESILVDPNGDVLYKAAADETLLIVDIDLTRVDAARRRRPYLAIRRPESYER